MATKNLFKSVFAVAFGALSCVSCVQEDFFITPEEDIFLVNGLVESRGLINTEDENASKISLQIDLSQDTIMVESFEELVADASTEFLFSDTQEASITENSEGVYRVENISYRDYSVEDYSLNRRKVTLNFRVDYSYNGEKRDTVLSPWYFQETPVEVIPQEPVDVVTFTTRQTIKNNSKGTVTATLFVDKIVNQQVDTTYKAVVTLARVGEVSGMEVHTVSTACSKEDMTCDTLSVSEKVVKDFFYTTTEERLYKWETNFTSTTGGKVSPKNEIKFVLCSKVVFEAEGFKYTWSFNGSANDVVRTIEDKGLEGKEIEGTYSPYLGTYVLKVNAYLFSPQVEELDGSTPFHSSTAENHLYQRESVE
jgi:hypothetical protein